MDMKPEELLIHTLVTPGYVGWAELFLESLRYRHGERFRVRIDGRDLGEQHIALVQRTYGNIDVRNRPFDWEAKAREAGVDVETFHRGRRAVEKGYTTEKNFLFKIAISVNERYRSMESVAADAKGEGFTYLLHSDADMYIRKPLDPLFAIMKDHDLSLYIKSDGPHTLRVFGGWLGFHLNDRTDRFMSDWMAEIDKVPFLERWKGFGQSALWFAIDKAEYLKVANLMTHRGAPRYSNTFAPERELWLGNSGSYKIVSLRRCWADLLKGYPRVPLPEQTVGEKARLVARRIRRAMMFVLGGGLGLRTRTRRLFRRLVKQ